MQPSVARVDGWDVFAAAPLCVSVGHHMRASAWFVLGLFGVHSALVTWSSARHSPTLNEPGLLSAGISHWQLGHFELYRVNPPLVRLVAALPVLVAQPKTDWTAVGTEPGRRPEYVVGSDFIAANGPRSMHLFRIARLACLPFSLVGGAICWFWARDLFGRRAGLAAATLWCLSPSVLAHAPLMTNDAPAAALAVGACYAFWRWLRDPTWRRALLAGFVLGLAQLTKSTLIVLLPVWLLILLRQPRLGRLRRLIMLATMFVISVDCLNAGYGFQATLQPLGSYEFVSRLFADGGAHPSGNRFKATLLASVPVPLPRDYVLGIDAQRYDFEHYEMKSYLRGTFRRGGWWDYYLYGLGVKVPLGTLALLGMGILLRSSRRWKTGEGADSTLIWPAVAILLLVSSQTGFSAHLRYVLPVVPFGFVWLSFVFEHPSRTVRRGAVMALIWSVTSSVAAFPHSLSYFNELAGGPAGGPAHLLGSNVEWGQDLLLLRSWSEKHPSARPLQVHCDALYDPAHLGIDCANPSGSNVRPHSNSGWYAVGVNALKSRGLWGGEEPAFETRDDAITQVLAGRQPVDRVGYSILLYDATGPALDRDTP